MKKTLLSIIFFLLGCIPLLSQNLSIDPSFHYMDRNDGQGYNGKISVVVPLHDGRQLVGGEFSTYNGKPVPRLIRLFSDGQLDSSFKTDISFSTINTIRVQTDGKILIGGIFANFSGRIVRLNPDGDLDNTFQTNSGFNGAVGEIWIQSDGKILAGGQFTSYRGQTVPSLIRINPDGSRDSSFNPQEVTDYVHDFTFQADGKILVNFSNKLIRLYPDGTKDNSFQLEAPYGTTVFDPDHPEDGYIRYEFRAKIYPHEDGKILVQGDMRNSRRESTHFMRLLSDGSIDRSFSMIESYYDSAPVFLARDQEGKIFALGSYYSYSWAISYLGPDGSMEKSYTLQDAGNFSENFFEVQQDGKFLVSGDLLGGRSGLVRFNRDGSIDRSYNPTPEFSESVIALSLQPDGKIIAGGKFTSYNGTAANSLARIHSDGTPDETFNVGKGLILNDYKPHLSISVQPDNRILLVGSFNTFDGSTVGGIVRLNPDGSRDESFQTGTGLRFYYGIKALMQDDGKVILAIPYSHSSNNTFNGEPVNRLIRLNTNGSIDYSFDVGSGFYEGISSIAIIPGGKILVGFLTFNGKSVNGLVRLNPDGSLDPTFDVKEKPDIPIKNLVVQDDGKILAIGADGTTTLKSRLMRFNPDGSPDLDFNPEIQSIYPIGPLTLQSDNKILLTINPSAYENYLVRLLPDGRIDPTLKMTNRFNGIVNAMSKDSNGNLLVGGNFTSFNGIQANRIAQIQTITKQPAPLKEVIRINAGGPSLQFGTEEWLADTHFSGGRAYTNSVPIADTEKDILYQTERYGDIKYEIPVPEQGVYTLELHFAEIHWSRAGSRIFDLFVENNIFRSNIDLAKDIGINTASVLRIENVEVTDENLSLELISQKDNAKISGIALFKQEETKVPETIRINAGGDNIYYANEEWLSDRYYLGGQTYFDDSKSISNTMREQIYHSERNGKFSYHIPVPKAGRYNLSLHFAEIYWETAGKRIFDVQIENGQQTLENLDLVKSIGEPNRANSQIPLVVEVMDGTLDMEFVPRTDRAKLSGLTLSLRQPDSRWDPIIKQPEDVFLDEGQRWSYQIDASSQREGVALTYFAHGLPDGVVLDPNTGKISGVFDSEGTYKIALKVSTYDERSFFAEFTITVNPLPVVARINAGGGAFQFEEEEWQPDRYYTGGRSYTTSAPISNTSKETLYQSERNGDFSYQIPVPEKGAYTVELHFAEIHWKRSNARLFRFRLENSPPTDIIDLYKDHGGANNAYVLRIPDVQVVDGVLNLELITEKDRAKISGIAVYKQRQTYPPAGAVQLRVNAGGPAIMLNGEEWMADSYFEGGRTYGVGSVEISNTDIDEVYRSERYGNFNYSLPVPEEGSYTVELLFAEIHWNKSGARVFGMEVENGQFTMDNIDLFRNFGGKNSAYVIRAENIKVSDGYLDIKFTSQVNNAKLSGISLYKQNEIPANARISQEALVQVQQESGETDSEESDAIITLYPNPARDRINLEFDTEQFGVWNIVLINSLGVPTYSDRQNLEKGRHHLEIDLSAYRLGAGTYYLHLSSDKEAPRVLRVIIQ